MNKREKSSYECTKRYSTRRRRDIMNNIVHDREYTFADQYYEELQADYYASLMEEKDAEN